jgi:hypothetical protein
MFEVESFTSGTRRIQSTLALSYLMRDREMSDIVAPKYDYEDLVYYVPIEAEEVHKKIPR